VIFLGHLRDKKAIYAYFFRIFDYLKVERAFVLMYLGHLIIFWSFYNTFRGLGIQYITIA
jgi:hypothetical protein